MKTHRASKAALAALALTCTGGSLHAGQVYLDSLSTETSFSQFIVHFKANSRAATDTRSAIDATAQLARMSGQGLMHQRRLAIGADVIRVQGKPMNAVQAERFMLSIAANPDVAFVQPDAMMQPQMAPNDTRYAEQWHYLAGAAGLNLQPAWDITTGAGVVIAVIDTGVTVHSDLAPNLIAGYDFISDIERARDGDGRDANPQDQGDWRVSGDCGATTVKDSSWHGTHTTGTVVAVSNNAKGVAGVAFGAKVQPLRVMGKCGGSISDIADAIIWASGGTVAGVPANPTPAKVINMSLGGSGACDVTYQTAISGAVARGTTVVVAAGNSNVDASGHRPANCTGVITVASLDRDGNRAYYSNFGPMIDISAPGGETATSGYGVLSTWNAGLTTPGVERYAFLQGTSMAAPHIAGLAALMVARSPTLTPAQVEATLRANVRAIAGSCTGGCGAGLADATKTLQALGTAPANVPPTANFSFVASALVVNFTDSSTDSDGTIASRSWNFGDATTSTVTNPVKNYAAAGTYNVTLTVTDNKGAARSISKSVVVASGGTTTVALTKGVAATGLSAAIGASLNFTLVVPAGATALSFVSSAGTGNADLHVKFGSVPTDTVYDCRPLLAGNAETCNFATTQAGTYYVRLKATAAFSAVSLLGNYTPATTGGTLFQNTADYAINDNSTVNSPISVSGIPGNAPTALSVAVNIVHTWPSDLRVDLVAPDGSIYTLHNRASTGSANIIKTYTVNAASEVANGVWNLRVNDNVGGDTGYINSWSLQF